MKLASSASSASTPLPAKAVRARLLAATEVPSWAAYLPKALQQSLHAAATHEAQGPLESTSSSSGTTSSTGHQLLPSSVQDFSTAKVPCKEEASSAFEQHIWHLAQDPDGCREVQQALEHAGSDEERQAVASQLHGHVWEALRCPHANHVIQKCIVTMRPQAFQFIIDEITHGHSGGPSGASQAARHRYGCRILERLIEHCSPDQVANLVEEIVSDAMSLSKHPYGNYVIQHLLEYGQPVHKRRIMQMLQQNASVAGSDCYARAVISQAFLHGPQENKVALARTILREPGLICTMARTRHGHLAAKFMLQQLEGTDRQEATRQLAQDEQALRSSRYGRFVAACLQHQSSACLVGNRRTQVRRGGG